MQTAECGFLCWISNSMQQLNFGAGIEPRKTSSNCRWEATKENKDPLLPVIQSVLARDSPRVGECAAAMLGLAKAQRLARSRRYILLSTLGSRYILS